MGRRRGFLSPARCEQCGKHPELGQTLWPGDQWLCVTCLENHLPGKDATTKSLNKMLEYGAEIQQAFGKESKGVNAYHDRNRGEWARMMAAEIKKQGMARRQDIALANGEAVPPSTEQFLHDALTIPDLAAVEASFDRSRLLVQSGTDVAAMALDASLSIEATNSLEKMLAHQMAALHKLAMEQMGQVSYEGNATAEGKRVNAVARCMAVYQQGLLALHKIRQNGQRITVQYVNVSNGSQAVIANVQRDNVEGLESQSLTSSKES